MVEEKVLAKESNYLKDEKTPEKSHKEQRVRSITFLYYSKPEIQKAIFNFSKNREVCPRYFEGFGKRPDSFQYPGDIFELVKKGATSFHCSEELWSDALKIVTGMTEKQANELRVGWDMLIDIDSKYFDYSRVSAKVIIDFLKFHGVKNIGIKFSGSKGLHLIIPWKAFPKEVYGIKTSDKFPEYPRIITQYIIEKTKDKLIEKITDLSRPNKYIKDYKASKEVMPDLVLVSPRHLFRMPYSLHEKTALASVVLTAEELEKFEFKDADPLKLSNNKIRNFIPECKNEEAKELLMQALDWWKENNKEQNKQTREEDFKKIKISNISEKLFPPCVNKILQGVEDGKKRSLFALINIFRSIGMEKLELEKRICEWNAKNKPLLREGYVKSQLIWAYNRKPIMPPNCKEFYRGIGVCSPDGICAKIKNPVQYITRKDFLENKKEKKK